MLRTITLPDFTDWDLPIVRLEKLAPSQDVDPIDYKAFKLRVNNPCPLPKTLLRMAALQIKKKMQLWTWIV